LLLLSLSLPPAANGDDRAARGIEIEGVQPASLDQPRVNLLVRRHARGNPLVANDGVDQVSNVQAFLDTGASGVMLSRRTANLLGVKRAVHGRVDVTFHDIGVAGGETFGVSETLWFSMGTFGGPGEGANGYPVSFGPVRAQINTAGGLIDMVTGGLDVVGMPAMKGRVVVFDPRPVDTFGATMLAQVLDPRADRRSIPKTDRHVMLSYASFERFTTTEPAGAQGPTLADNPFVGPSPVPAGKNAKANVPPVVVTLGHRQSSGSWLLDTGAAASIISTAQAERLGVTYNGATLRGVPEKEQFSLTVGGIGGMKKAAGFFLDTLTLPTRERDPIVYKRAPVLVLDITVIDPRTEQTLTLDGVLAMNYFVASANVDMAAGVLPDIKNLTVGAYEYVVFDEPAGTLGLKLKPEFKAGRPRTR
jgi:predicted aspartyl protease